MVYPTISILVKETKPRTFQTLFMHGGIPNSIGSALEADGVDCDDEVLFRPQWLFQPSRIANLSDRIMAQGQPLSAMQGLQMYRGVLTGLNEAFVVDQEKRDRFIAQNRDCASILRKLLGGEDLRPWYCQTRGAWLIVVAHGTTAVASGSAEESIAWKWLQENFQLWWNTYLTLSVKGAAVVTKGNSGGNSDPVITMMRLIVRKLFGLIFLNCRDSRGTHPAAFSATRHIAFQEWPLGYSAYCSRVLSGFVYPRFRLHFGSVAAYGNTDAYGSSSRGYRL